ncbi:MAG: SUMF1/EgtB/PvdO family nonheme iron enzyme, partial [Pseudomonadota bacterium]
MTRLLLSLLLLSPWPAAGESSLPPSAGAGEVCFQGGAIELGSDGHYPEERPRRSAVVQPFCLDRFEVTVAEFRAFVDATGYRTVAETGPLPAEYPDAPPEFFQPGSAVFVMPTTDRPGYWTFKALASWHDPLGAASSPVGLERHPVTQLAYRDAVSYARWRGRRLPTEAEWEFAAKAGGLTVSGDEQRAFVANTWQGLFPRANSGADGYLATAPVGSFAPDSNGLYDMLGNVWEW